MTTAATTTGLRITATIRRHIHKHETDTNPPRVWDTNARVAVSIVPSLDRQPETLSPFDIAGETLAINARSTPRLKTFLKLYPQSASITEAAKAAGIVRGTHYRALQQDPHYREAFQWVRRHIGEDLEACAIQQAKEGGQPSLMIALLKAFLPDEYARVTDGVQVNISLTQRMEEANQRLVEMYPAADAEGTP